MKSDKSEKSADLSKKYGTGSFTKETGKVTANNIFYGGKGRGLTIELMTDIAKAELDYDFDLTNQSQGETIFRGNGTTTFVSLGAGFGNNFGISVAMSQVDLESKFSTEVDIGMGTQTISNQSKDKTTTSRVRVGAIGNLGLDFGVYYEIQNEKTESDSPAEAQADKDDGGKSTIGGGIGYKAGKFHIEAFFEKRLKDEEKPGGPDGESEKISPTRYGGTIETRLW